MAFIHDDVFDSGLDYADTFANAQLDIVSGSDPQGTYSTVNANRLGKKDPIAVNAPSGGVPDGRRVTTEPVTDGSITTGGTATYWAITNGADKVLASGSLNGSVVVTAGNSFTLNSLSITIRDVVAV